MTNKIPQEIEDAVINHFRYQWDKDGNDDNSPDMSKEDIISELYLWFEGFLVKEIKEVFKAGQKQAHCSMCNDTLENTQLICWTCHCQEKEKVEQSVKEDVLKFVNKGIELAELNIQREINVEFNEGMLASYKQIEKELKARVKNGKED
jgi:hypothetical protein